MSFPARLFLCLTVLAAISLLPLLWNCAVPFLLAILLALCMERPVGWLSSLGLRRRWASALVLVGTLLLVGCGLWLAINRLVYELGQLLLQAPLLLSPLLENGTLQKKIYAFVIAAPVPMQDWLNSTIENIISGGLALPQRFYDYMTGWAARFVSALPCRLLSVVTCFLAAYYFSTGLPRWKSQITQIVPEYTLGKLRTLVSRLNAALTAWLRTQGWLMLITFGELLAGFFLLKIPYALIAALLGALADALPFFGVGTFLLPWALFLFLQGSSPAGMLILYAVTWLTRTALEPKLMGDQAGVPPLFSLAAMYIGFRAMGLWGLILAPALLFLLVRGKKQSQEKTDA